MKYANIAGKIIGGFLFVIVLYFGYRVIVSKDQPAAANSDISKTNDAENTFDYPNSDNGSDSESRPSSMTVLKLKSSEEIKGVGYFAEILNESALLDSSSLVLIKSIPCDNCDAPTELVLYHSKTKKNIKALLPGKYSYVDNKDPDQIVVGYFGHCSDSPNPSLVTVQKFKDGDGPWKAEVTTITFDGKDFSQKQNSIEVHDFETTRSEISKKSNCTEIKPEDQSYL